MKELWWEDKDIVSLMIKLISKKLSVQDFKNSHICLTALSDLLSDHIIQTSLFWQDNLLVFTLSFYYNDLITEYIKSLSEFKSHNWEKLKEWLCKDYLQQNLKQQYYLWVYLLQYKQTVSKKDLYIYCIQFWVISS